MFLGCDLKDVWPLNVLGRVGKENDAIVSVPSRPDIDQRELELSTMGIRALFYPSGLRDCV